MGNKARTQTFITSTYQSHIPDTSLVWQLNFKGSYVSRTYLFRLFFSFQALLTLFVFSTKDGWVTIMYDGIDAVGIDKQVLIA